MNAVKKQKYLDKKKRKQSRLHLQINEIDFQVVYFYIQCESLGLDYSKHLDIRKGNVEGLFPRKFNRNKSKLKPIKSNTKFLPFPPDRFSFMGALCSHQKNSRKAPTCPHRLQDNSPLPFLNDSGKSSLLPSLGLP